MDILVSTLCDFAADYQGKLCIQGGFDSLVARQFPVVHPVCAVALRICLTPEDEGTHELGLSIVDADGTPLDKDVALDADHDVLMQRIAKRAQEQGRSDDTPEAIAKRLATYAKETAPLLDTYKSRGQLVAIDGVGDIDAIQANIVAALSD